MISRRPIGSLIGLREGFAEPYIILHKNTFPPVLERIAKSNISNYSIYHLNGILFGFYDYLGDDFVMDMKAIADDPVTRDWWKLTEPMQDPLPSRKSDEWWESMDPLLSLGKEADKTPGINRNGFFLRQSAFGAEEIKHLWERHLVSDSILRIEVFGHANGNYIYTERNDGPWTSESPEKISKHWSEDNFLTEMEEVFHTDGCNDLKKKVFVTGCFDMLHSGHIAFLKEASGFGDLYVGIGSDANVNHLKGRYPVNTEDERKYMLDSVRYVYQCRVNKGWGIMDFLDELDRIRPDIFIVNEDGHTPEKEDLCRKLGMEYKVLKRLPHQGLPARSTTALRSECRIPFRIDLAGGWLDQPFVSSHYPGPVLTISIEPTLEFNDRSGMASSTRKRAIDLWKTEIPSGDPEKLAKMLFSYDNPPGTRDVSGSQDALGIVLPGLNRLDYNGNYWPEKITMQQDDQILEWLEDHLFLVTLGPRTSSFTVVENAIISEAGARHLAHAADNCWNAIMDRDLEGFGRYFRESFEAQLAMFPNMADEGILKSIEKYRNRALGWKLSGAGGGGYLILVADKPIEGAIRIRIRRKHLL